MLKELNLGRVAVFIDASNLYYTQKSLKWKISYKRLKEYFEKECNLVGIYIFATSNKENVKHSEFLQFLGRLGYTVITKPVKYIKTSNREILRKGNLDVEISMKMIDKCGEYDSLVLVSGDSDIAPTIDRLRSLDKRIIVVSSNRSVSKELLERAKYVPLKKLRKEIELIP